MGNPDISAVPDISTLLSFFQERASEGRTALLPCLHSAQNLLGYIPENVAAEISRILKVPLADVYGVIEFYALFRSQPVGKTILHVCNDPACSMAGADTIFKSIRKRYQIFNMETGFANGIVVEKAACLGLCEHAPAVFIQGGVLPVESERTWQNLVGMRDNYPRTFVYGDQRILTKNCGKGKTFNLMDYWKVDGYRALKKVITMTPSAVIAEIKASGLVGRGGAAFPTGVKWEGAANAVGEPKYVVCNADEAEPGTFKDRIMMEDDPHRVLEGLIIAAYAIGASKGYIYIRGEYDLPFQVITQAVKDAQEAGILGDKILGSNFNFEIEIRQGAGAYICGEETALFESIEGKRGMPRVKPPFPTTHGLFGKPTVINNVETLSNISTIILTGAEGYRKIGTEKSPGTKLFCLSGDIAKPGLYEVPFGITLRELIFDMAGGITGDHKFLAALLGGAAGAFAVEEDLDTRLTFEDLRAAGLPLGSGVITVINQRRKLIDIINRLGRFFAEESCGKCFPCQLGTRRQYEILKRILEGKTQAGDIDRLRDIGSTMTDASLCGLGQTAASAVLSAIKHWPQLFEPVK
jgi:NADH-quinone oxidoreductase subunit F